MRILCDVPCDLDPKVIKRLAACAWAIHIRRDPRVGSLTRIVAIRLRKGDNVAWMRGGSLWLNARSTQGQHVLGFVRGLLGRNANAEEIAILEKALGADWDALIPKLAPRPAKPKRPPTQAERLAEAKWTTEVWTKTLAERQAEAKKLARLVKSAKKKLRSAKASVRALEREVVRAPHNADMSESDFATIMQSKRDAGLARDMMHLSESGTERA